jgi:hypothetical protein
MSTFLDVVTALADKPKSEPTNKARQNRDFLIMRLPLA